MVAGEVHLATAVQYWPQCAVQPAPYSACGREAGEPTARRRRSAATIGSKKVFASCHVGPNTTQLAQLLYIRHVLYATAARPRLSSRRVCAGHRPRHVPRASASPPASGPTCPHARPSTATCRQYVQAAGHVSVRPVRSLRGGARGGRRILRGRYAPGSRPASLSRRTGGCPVRAGSGLIGWTARIERGGRKGRPEAEARRLGALAAVSLSPRRFDVDGGW
jgi:hypothetical protein